MKIIELLNNIKLPLNNEEADVLQMFDNESVIHKANLTDRQLVMANNLVNKDVLSRIRKNGKTFFKKKI
jgi:hypothetical protein